MCILCGLIKVFANVTHVQIRKNCNHLSGEAEYYKKNSGIGPCPSAPVTVKHKCHQLAAYKAHENTDTVVSTTARVALCGRRRPAGTAGAANGGETNPRT